MSDGLNIKPSLTNSLIYSSLTYKVMAKLKFEDDFMKLNSDTAITFYKIAGG